MSLPIFNTDSKDMSLLQTNWASALNPVIDNPITKGIQLKNVTLVTGANVINHLLGRKLQGWIVVRSHGSAATIYDTQDNNQIPNLTLQLNSSAGVLVDIYVY